MPTFSPSSAPLALTEKLRYVVELVRDHSAHPHDDRHFSSLWGDLAEYDELLRRHRGIPLGDARVLEVGFGAQPFRLLALLSMGIDARGVDPEVPLLENCWVELAEMIRRNGLERAAKSLGRAMLFDRPERRAFAASLQEHGHTLRVARDRFVIGDAAELELESGTVDLVYSEDVFEHIRVESLPAIVAKLAHWLHPEGIALIRPTVFTGITGGHLLEWSPHAVMHGWRGRRSEPWEHLRQRRWSANTQLNAFSRRDYRELLGKRLQIVEERVKHRDLGRQYLTPEVRDELRDYPDEELFSNQVLFVVRRR